MSDTPCQIMGILNTTPDSFSDGGKFFLRDSALKQAECMLKQGADIIDIGGESTRPGAQPVTADEELSRVIPVIEALRAEFGCRISIDTSKPIVMTEAVNAGASIINDVNALRAEDAMRVAASLKVTVCLMHMQGEPRTMQVAPTYDDVVEEVVAFLEQRITAYVAKGGRRDDIWVDPGFGFGKNLTHNLTLVAAIRRLKERLGCPVLVGVSRKSMIEKICGAAVEQRLPGSIALAVMLLERGASIFRVHDVAETRQALDVALAVMNGITHG